MQMDISGCACNSNGGNKIDNQLTAKSCRGIISNNSSRGDGGCGTWGGNNGVNFSSSNNNGIEDCNGNINSDSG